MPVNERHQFQMELEGVVRSLESAEAIHRVLNLVNKAYAQGYQDGDPDNRREVALPDNSTVILDGAGRMVAHIPPRVVLDGTVSGRFRTYVQGGHLVIWDEAQSETIALIEMNERVAFNIHRADGTPRGESPDDQQLRQVAEEVRVRWAASRAVPPPHYIVCLPHDFVDKLKARTEDLTDDHGVATGIKEALGAFIDQLDAWTEWDAVKGWR